LSLSCEIAKGATVVVRALWLPPDGPMVHRLVKATEGMPDILSLPPFEEFELPCYRVFGRVRVELSDNDVKTMYGVLRKSGYLRYELNEREGLDVVFTAGCKEPFRFEVVNPAR
jgi:hypothetical protein